MSVVSRLNPFQPDAPVRPSLFTGRRAELQTIRESVLDTLRGSASHVLIIGERGMGKTSLANYLTDFATSPDLMDAAGGVPAPAVLFVSLGYCPTVPEVCAAILNEAYRWARQDQSLLKWFREELRNLEGLEIGFFGVSFAAKPGQSSTLPHAFPDALEAVFKRMGDVGGLIVVLDETEAIAADSGFPGFMKSLTEVLRVRKLGNIQFVMTTTPEGQDRMVQAHESFLRLFRLVRINPLSDEEVRDLVLKALKEGLPRKEATPEFLDVMAVMASGIPGFVHELGRAAFAVDQDGTLDLDDLVQGIQGTDDVVGALATLEQRHFHERYSKKVLSNSYREILHAIAAADRDEVSTAEIRERCPQIAAGQVTTYLNRMVERGVVVRAEGKKGMFKLPDRMFKIFLRMKPPPRRG